MDPIELLKIEHETIERALVILGKTKEKYLDKVDINAEFGKLIAFIKQYAEFGHHVKEETVLFEIFMKKDQNLSKINSPLDKLSQEHIKSKQLAFDMSKMDDKFVYYIDEYIKLQNNHIDVENLIFPKLGSDLLETTDLKKIEEEFQNIQKTLSLDMILTKFEKLEEII